MKKIISLILICFMLSVTFVACNTATNKSSSGLEFELNKDQKSYTLVGIGTCKARKIVIDHYNGLPVTHIADYAFHENNKITSITIGNSVTSIGNSAFNLCEKLKSVTIPNSVTSIGNDAFGSWNTLNGTAYGNAIYLGNSENPYLYLWRFYTADITYINIHKDTKFIGSNALGHCENITNVTIPNGVIRINSSAFAHSHNLTSVTIGNSVTSIGPYAFSDCTKLTDVTIPDSVTSIGDSAFSSCKKLTSITIPNNVTSIGDNAFSDCDKLPRTAYGNAIYLGSTENPYLYLHKAAGNDITSINIHGQTRFISPSAFSDCNNLIGTTYDNAVYLGSTENPYLYLHKAANKDITSINIHEKTMFIGTYAFSGCKRLTNITIPPNVTKIYDYALFQCTNLTSITIPVSVTAIDESLFLYIEQNININYRGSEEQWKEITKDTEYDLPSSFHTITYNYTGE